MIPIPVYLRLWRLQASNRQLLKMYHFLYYEIRGEETSYYRREFSMRINRREKVNLEFENFLKKSINLNEDSLLSKFIDLCFPTLFSLDYIFAKIFFSIDLDRCQALEIKNIEMYYAFLYAGPHTEEITNLLLEQKSEIEDAVFIEI